MFEQARDTWRSTIRNSLAPVSVDLSDVPANSPCANSGLNQTVTPEGVAIIVKLQPIDGPAGVLGQAGPCFARDDGSPLVGIMEFDTADLDVLERAGSLDTVILHEMGHVLGFGTLWEREGLLENPSVPGNQGADTHFSGQGARAAFEAAFSGTFTGGSIVPVENSGQPGSGDGHWRESVLDNELMTPSISGREASVPMSEITLAALNDFAFYDVDLSQAEDFTVPSGVQPGFTDDSIEPIVLNTRLVYPMFTVDISGRFQALSR